MKTLFAKTPFLLGGMGNRVFYFILLAVGFLPELQAQRTGLGAGSNQGNVYSATSSDAAYTVAGLFNSETAAGRPPKAFEIEVGGPSSTNGSAWAWYGVYGTDGAILWQSAYMGYKQGAALVMANLNVVNGHIYADIYQFSSNFGWYPSSFTYAELSSAYAFNAMPIQVQYDVTLLRFNMSGAASGWAGYYYGLFADQTPPVTTHPGIRLPSGAVILSKSTQRTDANFLVSASVTDATEVIITRSTAGYPGAIGTALGGLPSFGATILDTTNMAALSLTQTPGTPGTPDYFALFAKGVDNGLWYYLGQSALSPYGTLLTLDITTPDSIVVGAVRRLRSEQSFNLNLDTSQVGGLLSVVSGTGTEAGDHYLDVQVAQATVGTKYFRPGPPVSLGATADSSSGVMKGIQSFHGQASDMVASVPGATPLTTMLDFAFSGWTRTISGAYGTFAPMSLAGPVHLDVYPQSSSSVLGFVDPATGNVLAATTVSQSGLATIPGTVTLASGFVVTITNPYPNSKHLLLLYRPDGSYVNLQTVDNTSTANTTIPIMLTVLDNAAFSAGDGVYKLYLLSQTPTDAGTTLVMLGIPAASFTAPDLVGYGWVSDGVVTINYKNPTVVINGSLIRGN